MGEQGAASLVSVAVVPTFSTPSGTCREPIALHGIDPRTTTVSALQKTIVDRLRGRCRAGASNPGSVCVASIDDVDVTFAVNGVVVTDVHMDLTLAEWRPAVSTNDGDAFRLAPLRDYNRLLADGQAGRVVHSDCDNPHKKRRLEESNRPGTALPTMLPSDEGPSVTELIHHRYPLRPVTVHVVERPALYSITLTLIALWRPEPITLRVATSSTIGDVRSRLATSIRRPPSDVVLLPLTMDAEDEFTDDERTMSDCGVSHGSQLYVQRRSDGPPKTIQVFVKLLKGETAALFVSPKALCDTIKAILVPLSGLKPRQMRLVCAGTQLEDGTRINQTNLETESTLHLLERYGRGDAVPAKPLPVSSSDGVSFQSRVPAGLNIVRVTDALGTVPFTQDSRGAGVVLGRQGLGDMRLWAVPPPSRNAVMTKWMGGDEHVVLDMAPPAEVTIRDVAFEPFVRSCTLCSDGGLPETFDVTFDFRACRTGDAVLKTFYAQVSRHLPVEAVGGLDVYLTPGTGGVSNVLVDCPDSLATLHCSRLLVREVRDNTNPALTFDDNSDSTDEEF